MDQLLFTIAKEILWLWLNSFGKNKYVIMIGGLNVELATFKSLVVVEWFWMAKCSHNCWSCITWFCKIFCESILQGQGDSCSTACLCIPFLCGVWSCCQLWTVANTKLCVLQLVHSVHCGYFHLCAQCVWLTPWRFALDHVNCSRCELFIPHPWDVKLKSSLSFICHGAFVVWKREQ